MKPVPKKDAAPNCRSVGDPGEKTAPGVTETKLVRDIEDLASGVPKSVVASLLAGLGAGPAVLFSDETGFDGDSADPAHTWRCGAVAEAVCRLTSIVSRLRLGPP